MSTQPIPPSVALARTLVAAFIEAGVTDAVLAPGSRNAPLSLALHDADAAGRIRLHVRIDERTAGFLALGLGRGSGRPALVATTSGTAVANLHPAVLEAHHGGIPLIVLSADRPPALRDLGANQVIDQRQVFGPALRAFVEIDTPVAEADSGIWRHAARDAVRAALGDRLAGPVQLNLPLAEPLLPAAGDAAGDWLSTDLPVDPIGVIPGSGELVPAPEPGEKVLFVADLTHPAAAGIAAAGHPVIAEAGGAAGAAVLAAGIPVLEAGFAERAAPDRVVVLGRPTLYRAVSALLKSAPIIDVVGPTGPVADPTGRARTVGTGVARGGRPGDRSYLDAWRAADAAARTVIARRLAGTELSPTPGLAAALVEILDDGTTLVLGSSQLPRDVGRFVAARDGLRVLANRGVAGIDGTVSTAIGAALATGTRTVALLGDLTFLHDLNGLIIGPHEPRPELDIVVANNDGGAIFSTLEPGQTQYAGAFERVFGTPHGADLGAAVRALGAEHRTITDATDLAAALAHPRGIRVLEVPATRADLRNWLAETASAIRDELQLPGDP